MDTEWNNQPACPTNSPPDCMEAFFSNILIHGYHGNGWSYKGPHDSQINRAIIFTYQNPAAKGLYVTGSGGSNAGLTGTTIHIWGSNAYALYLDSNASGINLTNVELEGSLNGLLMNGGFQTQIYNLWMYSCSATAITATQTTATNLDITVNNTLVPIVPGLVVAGAGITAGTRITAGSGTTGNFTTTSTGTTGSEAMTVQGSAIWYGDSFNSNTEFGSNIQAVITGTSGCGMNWVYEGQGNRLDATFMSSNPAPVLVGAPFTETTDTIPNWVYVSFTGPLVLSSCGGGTPGVNGSQPQHGTITLGTGSPTACTLTVGTGQIWPRAPTCEVTANNGTAWGMSASSTSAVTFTGSATAATLYYSCRP